MAVQKPRCIDIHAHTQFAVFDADRDVVVRRALDAGVWMINIGTGEAMSKKAVDLARAYPEGVYAIVGLHPIYVNPGHRDPGDREGGEDFNADYYRRLIAEAPKGRVVGIGECGLDFYHTQSESDKARQITAFRSQVELALELDLPLMLHVRPGEGGNAYRAVLDILAEYRAKHPQGDRLRGDAHFFAGTVAEAKEFLALGFHLSYTGVVTFAKQYKELVEATPLDRIMSETDCPYVAPVPERGKRCEPAFAAHVADKIAEIKAAQGGVDADGVRKALVDNALRLFRLG